jgi:hypothetical protein
MTQKQIAHKTNSAHDNGRAFNDELNVFNNGYTRSLHNANKLFLFYRINWIQKVKIRSDPPHPFSHRISTFQSGNRFLNLIIPFGDC